MDKATEERGSWTGLIIAVVFVILAFAFMIVSVVRGEPPSFDPATAGIIYRCLWPLLWLPGIGMCYVLFLRWGDSSLFIGALLQVAAIAIYSGTGRHIGAAGNIGLGGLVLPMLDHTQLRWRFPRWAVVVMLAVVVLAARQGYFLLRITVEPILGLWLLYARAIWPSVDRWAGFRLHQEAQPGRRSRARQWLGRATRRIALGLLVLATVAVILLALIVLREYLRWR